MPASTRRTAKECHVDHTRLSRVKCCTRANEQRTGGRGCKGLLASRARGLNAVSECFLLHEDVMMSAMLRDRRGLRRTRGAVGLDEDSARERPSLPTDCLPHEHLASHYLVAGRNDGADSHDAGNTQPRNKPRGQIEFGAGGGGGSCITRWHARRGRDRWKGNGATRAKDARGTVVTTTPRVMAASLTSSP